MIKRELTQYNQLSQAQSDTVKPRLRPKLRMSYTPKIQFEIWVSSKIMCHVMKIKQL